MKKTSLSVITKTPAAKVAFCTDTIKFKGKIEEHFLELGRRLGLIRDLALYAGQWETFEDYVVEFKNISPATASKLINIYAVFVDQHKISVKKLVQAGGWTLLAETLPLIKNKKDALEWLHKATVLTRTDLHREITEANTGTLQKNCKHTNHAYLMVCLDGCGYKERINELPKDLKRKELAPAK